MTREISLVVLQEALEQGSFINAALYKALAKYQYLEKQDRAFITRLCEGVVKHMITLDYVINCYSKVKTGSMKPVIRTLLRMGTYQILYMDKVPDSAACNETVKLAIKKGFAPLKGFVNGVLRTISRQKEALVFPDEESAEFLSVIYSMPQWIVDCFLSQYSMDVTKNILDSYLEKKETTIRINPLKTTKEELLAVLHKEGVLTKDGEYLPYAIKISGYNYLEALDSFRNGYFQVQDEASMLLVHSASIQPGNQILDVCAAPGGKATHAAECLNGSGMVIARDLTEKKTAKIQENMERLGIPNMQIACWDALVYDDSLAGSMDVVIADLPCTGLGVMRRKADIKYKTMPEDIKVLQKLQREILTVIQAYVKPSGILMYSTCTLTKEENEENRAWFLEQFPFETESLDSYLPDKLCSETTKLGYLTMLPGIHKTDGFFWSRFRARRN